MILAEALVDMLFRNVRTRIKVILLLKRCSSVILVSIRHFSHHRLANFANIRSELSVALISIEAEK